MYPWLAASSTKRFLFNLLLFELREIRRTRKIFRFRFQCVQSIYGWIKPNTMWPEWIDLFNWKFSISQSPLPIALIWISNWKMRLEISVLFRMTKCDKREELREKILKKRYIWLLGLVSSGAPAPNSSISGIFLAGHFVRLPRPNVFV